MTRWLVTGAAGQLGREVLALLVTRDGDSVSAYDRADLDVTDPDRVAETIAGERPDVVVNCAAFTDVDAAESDEPAAMAVNADGPAHLAVACVRTGSRLLHVSTDYVFGGTSSAPIREDHPVSPINAYGRSKARGEQAVLDGGGEGYVMRTSWLYGRTGRNFVTTIQRLVTEQERIEIVADQHGSPTWARDAAAALVSLGSASAKRCPPGVWHFANAGQTTWYGFAREILTALGLDPARVRPTTTAALGRPAARPAYSVLSTDKWVRHGLPPPRPWQQALSEFLRGHGLR